MSLPKKGQRNQFIFPMIETDGLSVASTLTASQLRSGGTRKFWGVNHNDAALAVSGTPSQTASLLKSGIFQIKMNAAECVYDRMNIIFTHATCLDQDLVVDFADYDDSDIMSMLIGLSAGQSDIQSYLIAMSVMLSDVHSGVTATRSVASDVQSYLVGLSVEISDIYSAIQAVATTSDLRSRLSDIQSYLVAMSVMLSDVHSGVTATRSVASDVQSYLVSLSGQMSDIYSAIQAVGSTSDVRSRLSDIQSYLAGMSAQISDFRSVFESRITGVTATKAELASAVESKLSGTLSDIQSGVTATRSVASDIQSYLLSLSGQISDIYSAVQAGANTSDLRSRLSDIQSYLVGLSAELSDTYSAAGQGNARTLVVQSLISDVQSAMLTMPDSFLNRNIAGGGSGNTRNVRNSLRATRNRVAIAGGVMKVYQENDTTVAWSAAVTQSAANPITEIDPT